MLREKSIWGRAGVCLLGFGLCRHLEKSSGEEKEKEKVTTHSSPRLSKGCLLLHSWGDRGPLPPSCPLNRQIFFFNEKDHFRINVLQGHVWLLMKQEVDSGAPGAKSSLAALDRATSARCLRGARRILPFLKGS